MENKLFKQICGKDRYYHDQTQRCYALVDMVDHKEVMFIDNIEYRELIELRLYQQQKEQKMANKIIEFAKLEAKFNSKQRSLYKRVAEHDGCFYYDMTNVDWGIMRIAPNKWEYGHTSKVLFERCQTQTAQLMPNQNGDFNKIDKYIKNVPTHQQILVKVNIIASLVPNISHALVLLQSEKGSGKSTLTQMIKAIVDPGSPYPLQLDPKELVLNLNSNYLANFDNLSYISPSISDVFCRAVTGATSNKRKLYADTRMITIEYKNCVLLNGINLGTLKDDLLDRSILIVLKKPKSKEMMSDTEYWGSFNKDLPDILGGMFTILSKAMSLYDPNSPKSGFRLIDYADWGYAIAEAMGGNGQDYIDALNKNRIEKNQALLSSSALCVAIREFMRDKDHWAGQPSVLLTHLDKIAIDKRLGKNERDWPSNVISLGMKLPKIKSILSEDGIIVKRKGHVHKGSLITITKK